MTFKHALLCASLTLPMAAPAWAAEPFDYDYLGITYDYQRIGADGFSEEFAGHKVAVIYSEELRQGLVYQAFADTEFVDDDLVNGGDKIVYERDAISLGASLGVHLPVTAKADFVSTAKLGYSFFDTYERRSMSGSSSEVTTDGSEAYIDLSAGVRWFIDAHNSLDFQPLVGAIVTEDNTDTYLRGRASFRLVNAMEVYVDMTTYLDSDFRAFGTGMFMYY